MTQIGELLNKKRKRRSRSFRGDYFQKNIPRNKKIIGNNL